MTGVSTGGHFTLSTLLGVIVFLIVWIGLFECTHVLIALLRGDRLIGWAIGPFGVTTMFLHQPSSAYILLNTFIPGLISGFVVYLGFFTSFPPPFYVPRTILYKIVIVALGVLLTSTSDFINALRDMRYPLWGEARILRRLQLLHASWASIHFTRFGLSYLRDQFGATPKDLLQVL